MNKSIVIDWLQLNCDGQNVNMNSKYIWLQQNFQTKQFRHVHIIKYNNEEIATVVSIPVSSIIPYNTFLVKFSNRELYGSGLKLLIDDFLAVSNLTFKNMTRIDIACDFNYFFNSMIPSDFIGRFLKSKYLKIGQGKYTLIGSQEKSHTYDYIRFGSKTSDINVYLYNKTKELKEAHDKPYIRESWYNAGLNTNKDIWRLEVSLKGSGSDYVNESTGEWLKLHYDELFKGSFINYYYQCFVNKYFRFVVDDGLSRKDRMSKVRLFDDSYTPFAPCVLPAVTGSNRSDKIFLKKIYQLDQELRGFGDGLVDECSIIFDHFAQSTDLDVWASENRHKWHLNTYRNI